ncbi:PQ loop protein [Schizosaccharomyces japonicus yFS275]|uniref:PQ loop protein n=1 Tax=Schizosaccharomyces japonicus (strain yFS275 / FY16936) TaxID=402676 RepID=B6K7S1_SCHJY|nr:PQ loop protein [Schizosaccharomyces japonicus yFS275]EEB09575.1 PQ loop protein [Schizosaccharomyces japonicus yFS275]
MSTENASGTSPNKAVATTLAIIATVCWCVQLIPQIIKNHRAKSTEGLDTLFMLSWVVASIFMAIYNFTQNLNIALKLQPELFHVLALITWFQCLVYGERWSRKRASMAVIVCIASSVGIQLVAILLIKMGIRRGVTWPTILVGVIMTISVNVGFVPQYIEILKARYVRGISYLFLFIDSSGALLSFISLPFEKWDVLAAVDYGLLYILEIGIFVMAFIFNYIYRGRLARSSDEGDQTKTSMASNEVMNEEQVIGFELQPPTKQPVAYTLTNTESP